MYRRPALTALCLLSLVCVSPAFAVPNKILTIEWEQGFIRFNHPTMFLYHGPVSLSVRRAADPTLARNPIVDCVLGMEPARTKCWKLKHIIPNDWGDVQESYGNNMRFVNPIAILPPVYQPDDSKELTDDELDKQSKREMQWYEDIKHPDFLKKLPNFNIEHYTDAELSSVPEGHGILGMETERHIFAPINDTIGGEYALSVWQQLIGKLPNRVCYEGEDYCSVIVKGKTDNKNAIVYCSVMNTSIGIGIPFNCDVVAFVSEGTWFVLAYDSPEQCDGCGAVSGATCLANSDMSVDDAAALFTKIMKSAKTNIEMRAIKHENDEIVLAGRNIATDSRFFAGYYDKSYAVYTIAKNNNDTSTPSISISGLFNLLISAEPSQDSINYRDFGTGRNRSDLEWFQEQVFNIVRSGIEQKLGGEVTCEVDPID